MGEISLVQPIVRIRYGIVRVSLMLYAHGVVAVMTPLEPSLWSTVSRLSMGYLKRLCSVSPQCPARGKLVFETPRVVL